MPHDQPTTERSYAPGEHVWCIYSWGPHALDRTYAYATVIEAQADDTYLIALGRPDGKDHTKRVPASILRPVEVYRDMDRESRKQALRELSRVSQEMGLE